MVADPYLRASAHGFGLATRDAFFKRTFDIICSLIGLVLVGWLIVLLALVARLDTGASGIFRQNRVGLFGRTFTLYKLRTMRVTAGPQTTVTTATDSRITKLGALLRRTKLDELPQLVNVLAGQMSFVGPRPDVPDTYTGLDADALRVLTIRPGITGLASLTFRREEEILAAVKDPEAYNRDVIFPEKIRLNLAYIDTYSILLDLRIIKSTILGGGLDFKRKQSA